MRFNKPIKIVVVIISTFNMVSGCNDWWALREFLVNKNLDGTSSTCQIISMALPLGHKLGLCRPTCRSICISHNDHIVTGQTSDYTWYLQIHCIHLDIEEGGRNKSCLTLNSKLSEETLGYRMMKTLKHKSYWFNYIFVIFISVP